MRKYQKNFFYALAALLTKIILYISHLQRRRAVNLNIKILDLCNEFLMGAHLPNKVDKHILPEHIRHNFAVESNYALISDLSADNPDDLVRIF